MKLTDDEVELLDAFSAHLEGGDRSMAVRQALGLLRMELQMNGLSRLVSGTGFLHSDMSASWAEWFAQQYPATR